MAVGPIPLWQIEGEKMEARADFIFLVSKITADSYCSHEIKRHLLLGRKAMTNLDSVLKSRDITLPTRVHIGKAMVFPAMVFTDVRVGPELMPSNQGVVKTLESPWAARKSNQSTLKENQP